jgi:hypothetical protein
MPSVEQSFTGHLYRPYFDLGSIAESAPADRHVGTSHPSIQWRLPVLYSLWSDAVCYLCEEFNEQPLDRSLADRSRDFAPGPQFAVKSRLRGACRFAAAPHTLATVTNDLRPIRIEEPAACVVDNLRHHSSFSGTRGAKSPHQQGWVSPVEHSGPQMKRALCTIASHLFHTWPEV